MLYLGKIFIQLVSPLGLCLLLAPVGMILVARRWRRTGWFLIVVPMLWLYVWSTPLASFALRASLEQRYEGHVPSEYPVADAIVVLGGGIDGPRAGWRRLPHLLAAADRVWFAAQLFHAGRAPNVILSGGGTEWSASDAPEADAMTRFMTDLGVPEAALIADRSSRNTWENAVNSKQLIDAHGFKRVLLVTSALHMPRALAVFRKVGVDVTPAPADFGAVPPRASWLNWLPDPEALDGSSRAIKEYLGLWIYRVRGMAA